MTTLSSRSDALAFDAADPLAAKRELFDLPDGIYLDGNSLGPLPFAARERVRHCLDHEWGEGLIASWNTAGWIDLPRSIATKIAPLIGAGADDVRVADSTSVNLFKVLAAALAMRPDRTRIVSQRGNFPTDLYMVEGLAAIMGGRHDLHLVDDADDLSAALNDDTAVLMLTHIDYKSGEMLDMDALTKAAHDRGALTVWDLAHSAGAVPLDLANAEADFAVGCGYKYLNGGPGAPAFLYVAPKHQAGAQNPLTGWFAHTEPFAFDPHFRAAEGMNKFLVGTPPVLSAVALDAALSVWDGVSLENVRAKSIALTELFIALIESNCPDLMLATPREAGRRGSQVSFQHPDAYPIVQCLITNGVTGDFRAPNIARFGFTSLYTRYVDVWDAATILIDVMHSGAWKAPEFGVRRVVT